MWGQVPLCHDRIYSACGYYHKPGTPDKPGRDYVFGSTDAAFEFGYGIGYSEIEYHSVTAEQSGNGIKVFVELKNKGTYDADEAVLIFICDEVAAMPQPIKKLACFERVFLSAGEKKTVELFIPEEQLMFTDMYMRKRLENGWFTIMAGSCSTRLYVETKML